MRTLEKALDKKQNLFQKLRQDTLEPAESEARKIIGEAQKKAEEIKKEAQKNADLLIKQAKAQIEQEKNVFYAALEQGVKQTLESLRQEIEHKLFNDELQSTIDTLMSNPKIIADLINGIVSSIEKEGIHTEVAAVIPRLVSSKEVCHFLIDSVCQKIKNHPIEIGHFAAGAQVKLVGKQLTVDITSSVIKELLANYVRKDYRRLIFS